MSDDPVHSPAAPGAAEADLAPEPVAHTLPGLVPGVGPDGRPRADAPLAAVTGVTGYVGGRLVPELLAAGYRVRALARSPKRLRGRPWTRDVEAVEADASDLEQIRAALQGVDVAYYLIHSLGSGRTFEARDRRTALTFAQAAREAGVRRVVYLGGLYPQGEELSPHLASRTEVGEILLASGVPTTVLRAAVILGSGSASFEMMRYLTERLPAMTVPRWVDNRIQPIAIRDVLRYLVGAAAMPPDVSRGFDIGGPDVLTYRDMMQRYAAAAGLRRRVVVGVGVLTPRLSSLWVSLVTPVPGGLARPLVESLVHEVVCDEHDIARWVPDPPEGLVGFDRAVLLALRRVHDAAVTTRWSSAAAPGAPSDPLPSDPDWAGGSLYVDERRMPVDASPASLWRVVEAVGGEHGWYSWPLAWRLRGLGDRLVGGPGLRRGRRDPQRLLVDDAVDFWRVEEVDPGRLLRLRAEMRVPGLAWLELRVETDDGPDEAADTSRRLHPPAVFAQRALFHPRGLLGHVYWWSVAPFHGVVFGGMQRNLARAAESAERARTDRRDA
ncbi:SDR family oxidoreductase [Cellulomonas fimi]|uniref:NAD-dependent epimerase/dehydratase n=1 Tax=Cellulomonas fimi (strain ATCC 484 / DSM 20113 / JCM 1341 / CCUG 24087 / LMG 16345 / NBRC 15513 / NCIMB 8980 / NCTC 7547 / NRS-133) TaxID=590998 RepID=F4H5S4_CELFA|nr:SDR family oxidoreductase [Cellulomonas fimi]AEE45524.1 NAD-dependent epimerase/dehydratase [Cellulomonas fimi ATCC 484]NNH05964.1 SDR family oxidoreductase [Cellulomonas fimi]VEH29721.1 Cholesterol dehydrogenase [Cellulomonas fimi]